MKPLFIYYPKCTTCQRALKWLKDNDIDADLRDVVTQNPTYEELTKWIAKSGKPISKFFNTSGLKYKAMSLKDVVKMASSEELIKILSSDGMLVKRPIFIYDSGVLIGFKEDQWAEALK